MLQVLKSKAIMVLAKGDLTSTIESGGDKIKGDFVTWGTVIGIGVIALGFLIRFFNKERGNQIIGVGATGFIALNVFDLVIGWIMSLTA